MKTKNKNGFAHIHLFLALLVVAGIGGVGYYVYSQNKQSKPNLSQNNTISAKEELPIPLEGLKSIEEIRTLAAAQANNLSITEVELEQEEGVLLYKVKLSNGRILFFDAKTGAAVTNVKDDDENDDENEDIPANFTAGISLEQARQTAQQQRSGKTIIKIELENEHGIIVYNVRFSDDGRVEVNATSGAVVRVKEPQKTVSDSNPDSSNSGSGSSSNSSSSDDDSSLSNSGPGSSNSDQDDEDEDDDDPDD